MFLGSRGLQAGPEENMLAVGELPNCKWWGRFGVYVGYFALNTTCMWVGSVVTVLLGTNDFHYNVHGLSLCHIMYRKQYVIPNINVMYTGQT